MSGDGVSGDGVSGETFGRLLRLAAELHSEPFAAGRPLWRAVLVEGLEGGRAAYLLKVHHSMTDGQGAIQLFDLIHGHRAEPTPDKPVPPATAARPPAPSGPLALSMTRMAGLLRSGPGEALRLAGGLGRAALTASSNPERLREGLDYAASLARVGSPPAGTPSPLLRRRGLSRRLLTVDAPLARMRAAGKAGGGTVNDAYVAALLGGLRRYHLAHGAEATDLPMALPISLRREGDAPGGNHFAAGSIAGPAGEADPLVRIRLVHERVATARTEPALDFMSAVAPVASRLPNRLLAGLARKLSEALDMQASNIPGLRRQAYIAGARIERMYIFGPVPGCAVMATLLSHGDTCHVGITVDADAVTDPDGLLAAMEESFAEIMTLGELDG